MRAGWPVGAVLGSESELLERYGVSRPTLREAIRLLEHRQIAVMRRGPGGGLSVTAPDSSAVAGAATAYLEYSHVTVRDVVEGLTVLQPMAAALAARRIDEDGIVRLRRLVSSEPAGGQWDRHHRFHGELAVISGDPALELFIDVSAQLLDRYAARTLATRPIWAAEMARTEGDVARAQARLAEAVIQGNAQLAEHIAARHLAAMLSWVEETGARLTGVAGEAGSDGSPAIPAARLATAVAERIRQDIRRSGWTVGANLGAEPLLQHRYQVSRTVLREAVRLLEYQGVASMRTGRSGGLLVAEPDADAVAAAVSLYLNYRHVRSRGLAAVQMTIELGCLDILAGRFGEQAKDGLRAAVAAEASGPPGTEQAFHVALAELTRNPVLGLWVRVLHSLLSDGADAAGEWKSADGLEGGGLRAVQETHVGIATALLQDDAALARHRMLRHLQQF
jgi:DNA-binding FadR family transcriptional regulator